MRHSGRSVNIKLQLIVCLAAVLQACVATEKPAPGPGSGSAAAWQLVWADEFDSGRIDPQNWQFEVNCAGGGNDEKQCYTARPENAFVSGDGILHIVAREESYSAPRYSPSVPAEPDEDTDIDADPVDRAFTSARLRSKHRLDFKYGRVEVRARLPQGPGMWPAAWMLPTDWVYGGWPRSGEIDIMEGFNPDFSNGKNKIHGTLHYGLRWPQWSVIGASHEVSESAEGDFHTYAIEWEADEIRWFVNGVHYQTQTSAGWYSYIWQGQEKGFGLPNPRAPYDQRFHLLLNLAVGGNAVGPPDTGWAQPREFQIDYVRVYQCDSGNADGTGCASTGGAVIDPSVTVNPDAGQPQVTRFPIFDDGPRSLSWKSQISQLDNQLVIAQDTASSDTVNVDTPDTGAEHGRVLQIEFNGPGQVSLSSADFSEVEGFGDGFDLLGGSAWSNYGTLQFDLLIERIDPETRLFAGIDSLDGPSGRVQLEIPPIGSWSRVHVRFGELLAASQSGDEELDLSRVNALFAIEAAGNGVAKVRIDNIALACVVNSYPQPWQPDHHCSIEPMFDK